MIYRLPIYLIFILMLPFLIGWGLLSIIVNLGHKYGRNTKKDR
jgi:hypothetical protein